VYTALRGLCYAEISVRTLQRDLHSGTYGGVAPTVIRLPRTEAFLAGKRATLDTSYRLLLQPLKLATDNARRWLLATLGHALAPTDHAYDEETHARTLLALLRAPGTLRFDDDVVHVTLDLHLPPTAHHRLADGLGRLDNLNLRFSDRSRKIAFRLAPRATREVGVTTPPSPA